jgi:hypothetical protein
VDERYHTTRVLLSAQPLITSSIEPILTRERQKLVGFAPHQMVCYPQASIGATEFDGLAEGYREGVMLFSEERSL